MGHGASCIPHSSKNVKHIMTTVPGFVGCPGARCGHPRQRIQVDGSVTAEVTEAVGARDRHYGRHEGRQRRVIHVGKLAVEIRNFFNDEDPRLQQPRVGYGRPLVAEHNIVQRMVGALGMSEPSLREWLARRAYAQDVLPDRSLERTP